MESRLRGLWREIFLQAPKTSGYVLVLCVAAVIILAGNSPSKGYPLVVAASASIFCLGLLYWLFGRFFLALSLTSLLVIDLQFIHQLKIHYYKDALFFSDFAMMADPANSGTLLHYPLAGLAFLGMLFVMGGTGWLTWRVFPRKQGILPMMFGLGMIGCSLGGLVPCLILYQQEWAGTLPGGTGVVSNLVMSGVQTQYVSPTFPGVSSAYFRARASRIDTVSSLGQRIRPDIVVLLQESTTDPRLYRLPSPAVLPPLAMFETGGRVKAHTPLRVQTFGGGTWLSEFAVLTGLRSDDFGALKSAVFYTVIDHVNDSLFKQMKRNGYYTVVLTPFNKSAYHAGHAYQMMGIDKIIQPQELGYPGGLQDNLWHISTADMLKYIQVILHRETGKPLFIYALTMAEHGPYEASHPDDFQLTGKGLQPGTPGKFSHYVEKITTSDAALAQFFSFVDHRAQPTLFLSFGDHQPNVDWTRGYATSLPDAMHLTQFSLRDNTVASPVPDLGEETDIAFLGGMILERAGLSVSPYWQANIAMRHLCKGRLNGCADPMLFNSYRHYIYDELKVASMK